jgi:hypothetical protein
LTALVGVDGVKSGFGMGLLSLEPTRETISRVGLSWRGGAGVLDLVTAYSAFETVVKVKSGSNTKNWMVQVKLFLNRNLSSKEKLLMKRLLFGEFGLVRQQSKVAYFGKFFSK